MAVNIDATNSDGQALGNKQTGRERLVKKDETNETYCLLGHIPELHEYSSHEVSSNIEF